MWKTLPDHLLRAKTSVYLFKTSCEDSCRSLATPLIFRIESEEISASTRDKKQN